MTQTRLRLAAFALALAGAPHAMAATGEAGGSGLIRIGQAYSLSGGRPVISIYTGYYTSSASGSERVFTLTPSATFGLGSGFEAAAGLPLEGATLALNGDPFDRRFDLSYRDIVGRVRWTGPLRTTRFRMGLEGVVSAPLGDRTRPGGSSTPDNAFDPGLTGLLSTNIGTFDFPIRIHLNAGWWWSRNDGAFYYNALPGAVAVPGGQNAEGNDLGWAGIGAEVGLQRATLLFELVTEQFPQARAQIHSSESLWLLTAGFRTALTQTVGLTGGLSLDLSSDDGATAFDPESVFPDAEVRIGITLGSVLSREQYEARKRREAVARRKSAPTAAPAAASAPAPEPAFLATPSPTAPAADPSPEPARLGELEQRVRELETEVRIQSLETRLRMLELERTGPAPAAPRVAPEGTAPGGATPAEPAPASAADTSLAGEVEQLRQTLQARQSPAAATPETPTAAMATPEAPTTAVTTPVTPVPATAPQAATAPPPVAAVTSPPAAAVSPSLTVVENTSPPPVTGWLPATPPASVPPVAEPVAEADSGVVPLEQLLREYEARRAAPVPAPAAAVAGSAGVAPATDPGFPLPVGGRMQLPEIDVTSPNPLAAAPAREVLDPLAAALVANPEAAIVVSVYGARGDLEKALALTELHAEGVRHYLVVAGADGSQVRALGMGLAPDGVGRVEVERLR